MKTTRRSWLSSFAAAVLALSGAHAGAADLELAPRHHAGDTYALSLRSERHTDASWKGSAATAYEERVQLDYAATVIVLEVDDAGRPLRERHENVRLTATGSGGAAYLFRDGTSVELRRRGDRLELFAGDERLERRTESIVVSLLAAQFERGAGPALLAPGRAVGIGDAWELDPELARRFLRERGVRAVKLGATPTATLVRGTGDALRVHYAIPVAWLEADGLPAHARASESEARVEGDVPLTAGGCAAGHTSALDLRLVGVVHAPGVASSTPWRVTSARSLDERIAVAEPRYATGS